MSMAKQHIEEIRRTKFSIGGETNPLTEDLHQAVKNLSAELYAKDVHFLMELIQNAEDNEYMEDVEPSLEFVITSRDITETGAPATLLIFNNEKVFSAKNIDSICSVGRSTKKGFRKRGYIGEKGIGFKSVFLITASPYIFSNGYQIRFNEDPCPHCSLGYIVPEWVDENPTLSDIKQIYGSNSALPTTVLILPLKPDKVKPVKQQLSSIHPEVLLFLSKIKRLSVREDNDDPRLNTVNAISILSETDFAQRKDFDAESYTLHLSAEENSKDSGNECRYYMWKQKFPVRQDCRVERRMEVEEWVITLAFPFGERPNRGMQSPGVYAFLPTEMVTNFPFIIQADFLLASSRETILLDNKWNKGILECVPLAFINAFISLVKTTGDAPAFNLPQLFGFLPIDSSNYQEFNLVRESIKAKVVEENIVPSESHTEQKFFYKPREVGRLMPAFWSILNKARTQGVSLLKLSSHGKYILSYSFDKQKYDHILGFLGVEPVDNEWYAKCIQGSNLVEGVSEAVYIELLQFIADNWSSKFFNTNIKNIPLIKYVDHDGKESIRSINGSKNWNGQRLVFISQKPEHISWLINCNGEFRSVSSWFFMPKSTQEALRSKKDSLLEWLKIQVGVGIVNVYDYAGLLENSLGNERKSVVAYVHFLYHSLSKNYISFQEVGYLCGNNIPLVNSYGSVIKQKNGVLVPANGSNWSRLIESNLWRENDYVELGEDYLKQGYFAGEFTAAGTLVNFLRAHAGASDVPYISLPNSQIPAASAPLTKDNAFLLLKWIRWQKGLPIPDKFLTSIREGSWLTVKLNGSRGYRPPEQSFLPTSSWGNILQNGSVLVDIPLIDLSYYGKEINNYMDELKIIGVMTEYGEACKFIGKHLMHLATTSTLSRSYVFSILHFIRFLRTNYLSPEEFVDSIRGRRWLKTSCGDKAPVESVLFKKEWEPASKISDIPFIDQDYYGKEILHFVPELQLLGVVVDFSGSHQLIVNYLKLPSLLTSLTSEAFLLMLECMHLLGSPDKLVRALTGTKCLKTNVGYKSPSETFYYHYEWGCLLHVFNGLPLMDKNFYGIRIYSFEDELKQIGVIVEFEEAAKVFARYFRVYASKGSITKENVASFLLCYRKLKGTPHKFPTEVKKCIREEKWLRTRLGDYRSPSDCILFGPDWESIYPITLLPFIDDSDKWYGEEIHKFNGELKSMGAIVGFKDGAKFVANGLYLPRDPSSITPTSALSLLECIKILLSDQSYSFPDAFMKKVSQAWLKTHAGYRPPNKCLLFDSKWGNYLKQTDGPFIDEQFYGSTIRSYRKELNAIGVIVDVEKGCSLIASHLDAHFEFPTMVRIYSYLSDFKWEPDSVDGRRIWIPHGNQNGKWVTPEDCVVSDKSGLFSLQLIALDKYYKQNLLVFFCTAFQVKSSPHFDDYFQLWKGWESSGHNLSHDECCKFWGYVTKHWNSKTEKALADGLVKVPVNSGSDGILLSNKNDVFIADDLQLKDLFEQSCPHPIFVWYPQPSLPNLPRTKLLEIFQKIGVRTISESVQKEEISMRNGIEPELVIPWNIFMGKGMVKLVLGFLAGPTINMEAERRKKAVKGLLNLTVNETAEPITVSYNLSLSSGENVNVTACRMIRWDKEGSKFFTQKIDRSKGPKYIIEFATYFSEVISEGILWEDSDHIDELTELIKLAFVLEFNEEAVTFLMKSKNLQIFVEDEDFLASAFPSD
ncbi:hypothetical protein FEM48_ZijujUnG0086000 [Ziziphus jujuba var. spinosa]|uniref:Sacsin/Nov domain-containing protein n=1 Tax=Ziziphus jujuba var. spinosa TaxID=714518 RepID=A0A978U8L7_ZIZJJ|nr:uncharacterized protein LOC107404512 [Ziziphus jujuba var. spinosa]KAH7510806.1 hypothetical protein FEM48_ZijujUnG0086000 [Ziziphus jujuba var. spinosa]